jgi:hypothetical protein
MIFHFYFYFLRYMSILKSIIFKNEELINFNSKYKFDLYA